MELMKNRHNVKANGHLPINNLIDLCDIYKSTIKETLKSEFPDDPNVQLWGAITAVFKSWNGKRAVSYRNIENIPHD